MGSFGDRLRKEREQRGISLDDIALTTKIRAGLLQALEEEKFDRLPGGIFNKGFVRAYARHLGLDEDQAVADYLVASGEGPIRKPGEGAAGARSEGSEPRIQLVRDETESESSASNAMNVWGIVAGLLVLVVVGAVAWVYYHHERRVETPSQESAPLAGPANSPAPTQTTNQAPKPAETPSATTPAATVPPAEKVTQPETASTVSPAGIFTVRLKADEDCWVQITADGKTEEVTLDNGLEKVINAKDRVTLRAGSVGALEIFFNGKRLPPQGEYGQVKTLLFGRDGLEAAVSKPSPTTVTP
jgi:cytoskeletal protein RodZ